MFYNYEQRSRYIIKKVFKLITLKNLVISDAALSRAIKRPKLEDDGYERPTTLSLSNTLFDGVNLNTITTPSHGLITPGLLNGKLINYF